MWAKVGKIMFMGNYNYNLDDKGRISIPTAFRDEFRDKLVCVQGFEDCIYLFTLDEWQKLAEKIGSLAITKSVNRKFARLFMSNAFSVNIDSKGRINLESVLIEHAHLEKECVFLGASNHVELWNKETWKQYKIDSKDDYSFMAEEVEF